MPTRATIAAQLSTVHSGADALAPAEVAAHLERAGAIVPLDILAVGWTERPELFHRLTATATAARRARSSSGIRCSPTIPASRRRIWSSTAGPTRSAGWAGYAGTGIAETFRQACPNNPDAVATSLGGLEAHHGRAIRSTGCSSTRSAFPRRPTALADVFSCFCPHC